MAKVKMPLMSGEASGGFGGTLVFGKNKGRHVVRALVTPSNPNTSGQITARNKMRVAAAIQKHINRTTDNASYALLGDEAALRATAPPGTVWNAYVTQLVVGTGGAAYAEAGVAWAAATASTWDSAANALTPPYSALSNPNPAGGAAVTVSSGEQFFRHVFALYKAGVIVSMPSYPPTYS